MTFVYEYIPFGSKGERENVCVDGMGSRGVKEKVCADRIGLGDCEKKFV